MLGINAPPVGCAAILILAIAGLHTGDRIGRKNREQAAVGSRYAYLHLGTHVPVGTGSRAYGVHGAISQQARGSAEHGDMSQALIDTN